MSFPPIPVTFDDTADCVGSCCPESCTPRLTELSGTAADLTVDLTCATCPASPNCGFCFPDTSPMTYGGVNLEWQGTSLCNNPMIFTCVDGVYGLSWPSTIGTVTIPTTVVSVQDSPLLIVITTSSGWFTADCDSDVEHEVTVTIYE